MAFDHYDRFFSTFAAGLGLLLAGVLNLVLGRYPRLCAAVTLGACVAVLAALGALTRPELAARAAYVLGGALVVAVLLGSGWVSRKLAALLEVFRRPAARWGLVALGGLVTLVASGVTYQRADEALVASDMAEMELMVGRPVSQPSERALATTDRGTRVLLREPITPRAAGELTGPEAKILQNTRLADQVIRRGGPTDDSNCHGWVFTGGKFHLGPDEVELVLRENGYQEVTEPHPGDVVVYRQNGAVSHTALVRYVAEGQPAMVEGKWGTMGVFLHPADRSCYGTEYTFHRSGRKGHLLVGLGGSPGPSAATTAVTE